MRAPFALSYSSCPQGPALGPTGLLDFWLCASSAQTVQCAPCHGNLLKCSHMAIKGVGYSQLAPLINWVSQVHNRVTKDN